MDAVVSQGERRQCGRRNRVVLASRRWGQVCRWLSAGDGGYKARHTGESTYKP